MALPVQTRSVGLPFPLSGLYSTRRSCPGDGHSGPGAGTESHSQGCVSYANTSGDILEKEESPCGAAEKAGATFNGPVVTTVANALPPTQGKGERCEECGGRLTHQHPANEVGASLASPGDPRPWLGEQDTLRTPAGSVRESVQTDPV